MRRSSPPMRPKWEVQVVQAVSESRFGRKTAEEMRRSGRMYYDSHYNDSGHPIVGSMAVRLVYQGRTCVTYGIVCVTDDDFEDKITSMKAAAMEKAAALEAVGATA
jgi:hypothetical protein